MLFLRFSEVFKVLALFYLKSALLGWKKTAGGRRATKNRVFCHKSVFSVHKVLFLGGKNPPEAAARRRTGLFVIKVCFLFKKCSFWVEKTRRRPPRDEEQGFLSDRQTYLSLRQTYVSLRQTYAFARLSKNHRILTKLIPYKSRWEILF